jgi:hypothetical protein
MATRGAFVAHVCRVVRFLPLQGCISIRISTTPSKMGDAYSPSPNVEMFKFHLMIHDYFKNVEDYFVVMAYDTHIVFDTFACLD